MRFKSKGKSKGILNTAIKPALLLVFDAIAATNVNTEAKAELPNTIHRIKDKFAVMGFPKKML